LEVGKLRIAFTKFRIREVITNCINLIKIQANSKEIVIFVEIDSKIPEFICSDRNRVQQILLNLLSNALKFTYEGYILCAVNLEYNINTKKPMVQFTVRDTGIGMKTEDLKMMFTLYGKLKLANPALNPTGCGLGLTISQNLAERLGEKIQVESKIKFGSTFWFSIDIDQEKDCEDNLGSFQKRDSLKRSSSLSLARKENPTISRLKTEKLANFSPQRPIMERSHSVVKPKLSKIKISLGSCSSFNDYDASEVDEFPREEIKGGDSTLELSAFGLMNEDTTRERANGKFAVESVRIEAKRGYQKYISDPLFDFRRKEISLKLLKTNLSRKCGCKEFLVVDDNDFNRLVIKAHIKPFGFQAQDALNGEQAVQKILEQSKKTCCSGYLMIFMDIEMPIMDGLTASKIISGKIECDEIRRIPIVAVTAFVSKQDYEKCITSGMIEYIAKPVSKETIVDVIYNLV